MVDYATNLQLMAQKKTNMDDFLWLSIQVNCFRPF